MIDTLDGDLNLEPGKVVYILNCNAPGLFWNCTNLYCFCQGTARLKTCLWSSTDLMDITFCMIDTIFYLRFSIC